MHNYWEIYEDDDENDGFYHASHTTRRPSFEVATVGEAVAQLVETHRAAANHAFHGVVGFVARFIHFFLINHHFRCLGGVAQFPASACIVSCEAYALPCDLLKRHAAAVAQHHPKVVFARGFLAAFFITHMIGGLEPRNLKFLWCRIHFYRCGANQSLWQLAHADGAVGQHHHEIECRQIVAAAHYRHKILLVASQQFHLVALLEFHHIVCALHRHFGGHTHRNFTSTVDCRLFANGRIVDIVPQSVRTEKCITGKEHSHCTDNEKNHSEHLSYHLSSG